MTGKTDLVVVGAGVGANKMAAAKAKGVEVWTEEHFMQVCEGTAAGSQVEGPEEQVEGPGGLVLEDYNKWTVAKLKAELDARGAATNGKKTVLVARLPELGTPSESGPSEVEIHGK